MKVEMGLMWAIEQITLKKKYGDSPYEYTLEFVDNKQNGRSIEISGRVFAKSSDHSQQLIDRISIVARHQIAKDRNKSNLEPHDNKKVAAAKSMLGIRNLRRNIVVGYKGGDVSPLDYSINVYGNMRTIIGNYVGRKGSEKKPFDIKRWYASYFVSWCVLLSVFIINTLSYIRFGMPGWVTIYISLVLGVASGMSIYALNKVARAANDLEEDTDE